MNRPAACQRSPAARPVPTPATTEGSSPRAARSHAPVDIARRRHLEHGTTTPPERHRVYAETAGATPLPDAFLKEHAA